MFLAVISRDSRSGCVRGDIMTYGTRRFKVGLGTTVELVDAIVGKWESKGFDVEVDCCTAGLYPLIRPERVGWGGADFDPHIGPLGQRYGRD